MQKKSIISFGQDVSLNGAVLFFSVLDKLYFDTEFKGVENVSLRNGFTMNCSSVACPESSRDIKAVYHNAEQGEFKMYFSLRGREYASTIKIRDFNLTKVETSQMM